MPLGPGIYNIFLIEKDKSTKIVTAGNDGPVLTQDSADDTKQQWHIKLISKPNGYHIQSQSTKNHLITKDEKAFVYDTTSYAWNVKKITKETTKETTTKTSTKTSVENSTKTFTKTFADTSTDTSTKSYYTIQSAKSSWALGTSNNAQNPPPVILQDAGALGSGEGGTAWQIVVKELDKDK